MSFSDDLYSNFSEIADVLVDAANGNMFIIVDDEDRENEGDLVVLASMVSAEHVNFMLKFGRGIVCLAISQFYSDKLRLEKLSKRNVGVGYTSFLTPIDFKHGISTGVSAFDRAKTLRAVVDDSVSSEDFITPGHIFPVLAVDGGVLARRGHTEASVEIAKLVKAPAAAVICEIMNEDGSMARRDDLVKFSKIHGIKVTTISKLVEYIHEQHSSN